MYYRRLYLFILCLTAWIGAEARSLSEEAQISLLTCTPGEELYARYGHTAIRVQDPQNRLDLVFNYGIFDFNTDHFYWKFVKGETWYELGAITMPWFMLEYEEEHRPVYEQVLNLNPSQRFVFDNCATRPYLLIQKALGDTIRSEYTGNTGTTYRRFIRRYTGSMTWANAGINLLFGPKADKPMNNEQRLFLPEELMLYMAQAHLSDGTPLVSESEIGSFDLPKTPWYASWPLGWAVYFIVVCLISWWDRRRGKRSRWLDIAVGVPYVLLLVLVAFLTFFSCHPLVGFGWRLLIIPLTHLCARFIYILR